MNWSDLWPIISQLLVFVFGIIGTVVFGSKQVAKQVEEAQKKKGGLLFDLLNMPTRLDELHDQVKKNTAQIEKLVGRRPNGKPNNSDDDDFDSII